MKSIRFTDHAVLKIRMLQAHGVNVNMELVQEVLTRPIQIVQGYGGRKVAQKQIDP